MARRLKIRDGVNLDELLKNFSQNENNYSLDSVFDEFIQVHKHTREIEQYGYNGLVCEWMQKGLLEEIGGDKR